MCYTMVMSKPILNRKVRMKNGEQNFESFVLPLVQDIFPGVWYSCNELPLDYEHGIDYVVINGAKMTTISARVWMGMPRQHFALRWKRTSDPFRKLELDSRLTALHNGEMLSDWTIEGFHLNGHSYIAMIPTRKLLECVDKYFECLPRFIIQNQRDHTWFKQVPFYGYGLEDHIHKVISPIW